MGMSVEELIDNFELFDDWEDRYRYVIDLGKKLPPMPSEEMVEENKVRGCMSQVWLVSELDHEVSPPVVRFRADSDAFIVKGLIAILMELYQAQTPAHILELDALDVMARIGLDQHLSPNRRNGLVSMVQRIKAIAAEAAQQPA